MKIRETEPFRTNKYTQSPKTQSKCFSALAFDSFSSAPNLINPQKVAFKGLREIYNKIFSKDVKDTTLSKNEFTNKLNKNKIVNINDFDVYCSNQNGYSENLTNKVIELFEKTKSEKLTYKMFNLCFNNGFIPKVYSDMKLCLDKKIKPDTAYAIFKAATHYGHNKYNPEVVKFGVENHQYCNATNFSIFLINSVNKKTNKFSPIHFDMLRRITQEHKCNVYIIAADNIYKFHTPKVTKELENQINILSNYGLSIGEIDKILQQGKPNEKWLQLITQDIPENLTKDKDSLSDFLQARTEKIKNRNNNLYTKSDKETFDYFNKIYNELIKHDKKINYTQINSNIDRIMHYSGNIKQKAQNFTLSAIKYLPLNKINELTKDFIHIDNERLLNLYKSLDDKDKPEVGYIWYYFNPFSNKYNGILYENFIKYYPQYKEKIKGYDLLDIIDSCWDYDIIKCFSDSKLQYALENIQKPIQQIKLELQYIKNDSFDTKKIAIINDLLKNGFSLDDLILDKANKRGLWDPRINFEQKANNEIWIKNISKLKAAGVNNNAIYDIAEKNFSQNDIDKLLDIRKEALNHRDTLQVFGEPVPKSDIDRTFLRHPQRTLGTLKIIGKSGLVQAFPQGLDNIENYITLIGFYPTYKELFSLPKIQEAIQKLIEITNPIASDKYKRIEKEIKNLKTQYSITNASDEKQELINKINTKTKEKNELLKNAIKDPQDVLKAATIFFSLLLSNIDYEDYFETSADEDILVLEKNSELVNKVLPHLNPKTPEEKELQGKVLNTVFGELYDIELSKETLQKLNLTNSKYMSKIFNPDLDFIQEFSSFVKLIENNKHKPLSATFNNLEQNKKTKELFKKYGLDYDSWTKYNPESKIILEVHANAKKTKQNVLKNLENDFNDKSMNLIPKVEKQRLFKAVENAGYEFKESKTAVYSETGELVNENEKGIKIYKNSKPIEFNDVRIVLSAIKKEMNQNDFWNAEAQNEVIDIAKENLKNHFLKLRYQEVKKAESKQSNMKKTIQIQKANMNDISHSLFLGNDAGCCTAIGTGCNMCSAPNYIKNKMVSCIEVKDGEKFIGNTMIYIAIIDNKPAILLDNIELKPSYQYNETIKNGIITYAKKIAKEISNTRMPIYAGPNRHKVHLSEYPLKDVDFTILGNTGNDEIYLDFATDITPVSEDKNFYCYLHKIR